jgi:SARP family transcriptional regulator, regulator of embCAB operon
VDIAVLGPCRVTQAGVSVVPTAVKPRKVLALLALYPDQMVSVPSLVEEVWGDAPPRSVQTTLQTYILQLRHHISDALDGDCAGLPLGPKSVLVTESGGYLLDTQGGLVDSREFDRLSAAGHRALEDGECGRASALFGQALALWQGPALVDVQRGPLLEAETTRLEESRLSTLSCRIEADLMLGRHHQLTGDLAALTARNPLHEGFHQQLMLALYRSGRRSSALESYHRLRLRLQDDLGLDPSPSMQQLQCAVLASDPGLDIQQFTPRSAHLSQAHPSQERLLVS